MIPLDYARTSETDYQYLMEDKYDKDFKNIKIPKDYCENIYAKTSFTMKPYQKFVSQYFRDHPGQRGLLVYHQLGSGKTLTSEPRLLHQGMYILVKDQRH